MFLLKEELKIEKAEILESLHFASLEKLFIENRIYKDKEFEEAKDMPTAIKHILSRLKKLNVTFLRELTDEDIQKLMEIKMARILRFNSHKADEQIAKYHERIKEIDYDIEHIVDFTIKWYRSLIQKYGANYPRKTEIRSFETIDATKVVEANEKLYINKEEGFIGTALKKMSLSVIVQ